ncbi:hypothetical protein [Pseudomonas synxantha]|uniref:hypothetical protein n=1 Tax=Pseudomonas synxantha TaxID=47883 RepID=UPI000F55EE86|nr:hypothetical protein [Pseudomonas synxantha]
MKKSNQEQRDTRHDSNEIDSEAKAYGWGYVQAIGVYEGKPYMEFLFDNAQQSTAIYFDFDDKNISWKQRICTLAFLWQEKAHIVYNKTGFILENIGYYYNHPNSESRPEKLK